MLNKRTTSAAQSSMTSMSIPMGASVNTNRSKSKRSSHYDNDKNKGKKSNSNLAKAFLVIALLWPLTILFSGNKNNTQKQDSDSLSQQLRSRVTSLLERYELVGYGPSHPRIAVTYVVTGFVENPVDSLVSSVDSLLRHTDRNRIFGVCVMVEPDVLKEEEGEKERLENALKELDLGGSGFHWHGLSRHRHDSTNKNATDEDADAHGSKIHLVFASSKGVSKARREAALFFQVLAEQHESAGIKSASEELLFALVRPDARFSHDDWLDVVTGGLIPPPIHSNSNQNSNETDSNGDNVNAVAKIPSPDKHMKAATQLANAIDLSPTAYLARSLKIDLESHTTLSSETDHKSFSTPLVHGIVTVLRLNTFLNLPARDDAMKSYYAADLELSLNLWLCADGIDILADGNIDVDMHVLSNTAQYGVLGSDSGKEEDDQGDALTRFAAERIVKAWAWTSANTSLDPYTSNMVQKLADFFWESKTDMMTSISKADTAIPDLIHSFPSKLDQKCRPFTWFFEHVNPITLDPKYTTDIQDNKSLPDDEHKEENLEPLVPLRPENQEIVSRTHPIDLQFIDVSNNNLEHPHMGALDENDQPGYHHDETALRKNPPTLQILNKQQVCGNTNDGTYKMLTQKVFVDMTSHEAAERRASTSKHRRAKLFCLTYTIEKNHHKLPAIRETWAPKCDGFMVASDKTDRALNTVNIPHEGAEEYHNIWQKVRSMWSYVYDNYYESYDWFHIGGDDLYLLVENLRLYLESDEIRLASNGGKLMPSAFSEPTEAYPLFLGRRFAEQGNMERIFNSGGSGYSMNKAALKALVVDAFPTCMPHLKTFAEDVMVAQCLRNKISVYPLDTKDEQGGERYMPFQPAHHFSYRLPKGESNDWYVKYSINIKEGLDHCAANSVAFHYIQPDLMKRMHAILYGHCN